MSHCWKFWKTQMFCSKGFVLLKLLRKSNCCHLTIKERIKDHSSFFAYTYCKVVSGNFCSPVDHVWFVWREDPFIELLVIIVIKCRLFSQSKGNYYEDRLFSDLQAIQDDLLIFPLIRRQQEAHIKPLFANRRRRQINFPYLVWSCRSSEDSIIQLIKSVSWEQTRHPSIHKSGQVLWQMKLLLH